MTKWYQGLNRLRFTTPTRAVVYRVRMFTIRLLFDLDLAGSRYG